LEPSRRADRELGVTGNTPAAFKQSLEIIKQRLLAAPTQPKIVTINAGMSGPRAVASNRCRNTATVISKPSKPSSPMQSENGSCASGFKSEIPDLQ